MKTNPRTAGLAAVLGVWAMGGVCRADGLIVTSRTVRFQSDLFIQDSPGSAPRTMHEDRTEAGPGTMFGTNPILGQWNDPSNVQGSSDWTSYGGSDHFAGYTRNYLWANNRSEAARVAAHVEILSTVQFELSAPDGRFPIVCSVTGMTGPGHPSSPVTGLLDARGFEVSMLDGAGSVLAHGVQSSTGFDSSQNWSQPFTASMGSGRFTLIIREWADWDATGAIGGGASEVSVNFDLRTTVPSPGCAVVLLAGARGRKRRVAGV